MLLPVFVVNSFLRCEALEDQNIQFFQGDNINHVEASDRHIVVFVVVWQHVTVYMNNTDLTFPQRAAS